MQSALTQSAELRSANVGPTTTEWLGHQRVFVGLAKPKAELSNICKEKNIRIKLKLELSVVQQTAIGQE